MRLCSSCKKFDADIQSKTDDGDITITVLKCSACGAESIERTKHPWTSGDVLHKMLSLEKQLECSLKMTEDSIVAIRGELKALREQIKELRIEV